VIEKNRKYRSIHDTKKSSRDSTSQLQTTAARYTSQSQDTNDSSCSFESPSLRHTPNYKSISRAHPTFETQPRKLCKISRQLLVPQNMAQKTTKHQSLRVLQSFATCCIERIDSCKNEYVKTCENPHNTRRIANVFDSTTNSVTNSKTIMADYCFISFYFDYSNLTNVSSFIIPNVSLLIL